MRIKIFSDTHNERNRLMEHVYPRMKEFCQMKGYEFQVVDMRWGIQHEAANDHSTVDLCLQELRNCQRLSTGPNFVSLLSHKYSYSNLKTRIEAKEFETLLQYHGMDNNAKNLLQRCYKKDENACPPEYVLLPINHNIPQYLSQNEVEQKTAKDQWQKECQEMVLALCEASEKLLSKEEAFKYSKTVMEIETQAGVLESKEPNKHCLWFHRVIENIENQPHSDQVSNYVDKENTSKKSLKSKMSHCLGAGNIHTYHVKWSDKGVDPQLQKHSQYLDKMTSDFESHMMTMIEKSIEERESYDQYLNKPLHRECVQHLQFCQEKLKGFYGREDTLKKIADYITGDSKEPLVIHGLPGCGKTCIMAAAAQKAWDLVKDIGAIILRFVRCSRKLITARFTRSINKLEWNYEEKYIFILDSVDQLEVCNGGHDVLSWLPRTLPDNVKVIISVADNDILTTLKEELSAASFVDVPDFSVDEANKIIDHWSKDRNRQLTKLQKSILIGAFKNCTLPLFLKLSAEKAFNWRSFEEENHLVLENSLRMAINTQFEQLERKHGQTFISHTLGYVTAARYGASESELEDVLSCDDEVLNSVYVNEVPPVRRLPPLILVRLLSDLRPYFEERDIHTEGVRALYWCQRQFIETAHERYLSDPKTTHKLHQGLADYFSGKWANDRNVGELKKECLMNVEFLMAKLQCLGVESVIEDFQLARAAFPADQLIGTLGDAFYLSCSALQYDVRQLPAQFIDRLSHDKVYKQTLFQMYMYITLKC
ncbi:hypothetical protein FSP39_012657 [Pinctada imbricata]|uniref:Uncharacterized protein n=1 Tax=Pinctada imbricata TaxID=66713 RepID=A0AA89BYK7_PINIB|nr:hypothetical protein FSP39_012657 [Pinctada imbricata]